MFSLLIELQIWQHWNMLLSLSLELQMWQQWNTFTVNEAANMTAWKHVALTVSEAANVTALKHIVTVTTAANMTAINIWLFLAHMINTTKHVAIPTHVQTPILWCYQCTAPWQTASFIYIYIIYIYIYMQVCTRDHSKLHHVSCTINCMDIWTQAREQRQAQTCSPSRMVVFSEKG